MFIFSRCNLRNSRHVVFGPLLSARSNGSTQQNPANPPQSTAKQIADDEEKKLLAAVQAAESATRIRRN